MDRLESLSKQSDSDRETNRQRRQVLALASHFSFAPGTVRVLEPQEGASLQLVEQLCRGEVTGPFMLDCSGMRHLYFDLQAVQSSMRLEDTDLSRMRGATARVVFQAWRLLFNQTQTRLAHSGCRGDQLG